MGEGLGPKQTSAGESVRKAPARPGQASGTFLCKLSRTRHHFRYSLLSSPHVHEKHTHYISPSVNIDLFKAHLQSVRCCLQINAIAKVHETPQQTSIFGAGDPHSPRPAFRSRLAGCSKNVLQLCSLACHLIPGSIGHGQIVGRKHFASPSGCKTNIYSPTSSSSPSPSHGCINRNSKAITIKYLIRMPICRIKLMCMLPRLPISSNSSTTIA